MDFLIPQKNIWGPSEPCSWPLKTPDGGQEWIQVNFDLSRDARQLNLLMLLQICGVPVSVPTLLRVLKASSPSTSAHVPCHTVSPQGNRKRKAKQSPPPHSQSSCREQTCALPTNYRTM